LLRAMPLPYPHHTMIWPRVKRFFRKKFRKIFTGFAL
jgi:hypothetical protein